MPACCRIRSRRGRSPSRRTCSSACASRTGSYRNTRPRTAPHLTDLVDHVIRCATGTSSPPDARASVSTSTTMASPAIHRRRVDLSRTPRQRGRVHRDPMTPRSARLPNDPDPAPEGRPRLPRGRPPDRTSIPSTSRASSGGRLPLPALLGRLGLRGPAPRDPRPKPTSTEFAAGLDVLVVCHGAPYVSYRGHRSRAALDAARRARGRSVRATGSISPRRSEAACASSTPRTARPVQRPSGRSAWRWSGCGTRVRCQAMITHEQTSLPFSERAGPGYDERS